MQMAFARNSRRNVCSPEVNKNKDVWAARISVDGTLKKRHEGGGRGM